MESILISSCLLGNNTKYNGKNNYNPLVKKLKEKYNLIPICPEVLGGLLIPREPSEINGDKVINKIGLDVTKNFNEGARLSLIEAKNHNIKYAILKDGSPSCGVNYIYDGKFSGTKINGMGITAKLLFLNNIILVSEKDIEKLI